MSSMNLNGPKMHFADVILKGTSPLLMDAVPWWVAEELKAKLLGQSYVKPEVTEKMLFEAAQYRTLDGNLCLPGGGLRQAAISAARNDDNIPMTQVKQAFKVLTQMALFEDPQPEPIQMGMAVRTDQGKLIYKIRAEIVSGWRCKFPVLLIPTKNISSIEILVNLLEVAGQSVGLCSWRTEVGGPYGTFTVDEVKTRST